MFPWDDFFFSIAHIDRQGRVAATSNQCELAPVVLLEIRKYRVFQLRYGLERNICSQVRDIEFVQNIRNGLDTSGIRMGEEGYFKFLFVKKIPRVSQPLQEYFQGLNRI